MRRKGPGLRFKRIPRDEEENSSIEKPGTQVRIFSSKISLENFSWRDPAHTLLVSWWGLGSEGEACVLTLGQEGEVTDSKSSAELGGEGSQWSAADSGQVWRGVNDVASV